MALMTLFSTDVVLRVTGASANQLKYWVKIGLVTPTQDGKRYLYSFRDIIRIKVVADLKNKGLSLQKIRKGIDNLAKVLPADDDPLSKLIIFTDGHDMVAMEKGMYFSATSMQRYFQFDIEQLQASIIRFQSDVALKTDVHSLSAVKTG
jgi:DNA-binding transcriptional MerR regulator